MLGTCIRGSVTMQGDTQDEKSMMEGGGISVSGGDAEGGT